MNRRTFLTASSAALVLPTMPWAHEGSHPFTRTEAEWRQLLTDAEYDVMRDMGTEKAHSSQLNPLYEAGTYHCKGCDQALYPSDTKFKSGTGWPSFWAPLDNAVGTKPDRGFFTTRTEVHCTNCGSHLGHVFEDGPKPTGLRHCLNGIALVFRPEGSGQPVVG